MADGFTIFGLFLAFCSFNIYIERKIEREINKSRELINHQLLEINEMLKELKQDLKTIKYTRYKNYRRSNFIDNIDN